MTHWETQTTTEPQLREVCATVISWHCHEHRAQILSSMLVLSPLNIVWVSSPIAVAKTPDKKQLDKGQGFLFVWGGGSQFERMPSSHQGRQRGRNLRQHVTCYICSQEIKSDEWWHPACFLLFIQTGIPYCEMPWLMSGVGLPLKPFWKCSQAYPGMFLWWF